MIAFCTHCWAEVDSESPQCFRCDADLLTDARSYEEKLIAALGHRLPAARVRICWLLGDKHILPAVPHLIELAQGETRFSTTVFPASGREGGCSLLSLHEVTH
jgi:hypothetical protein